MTAQERGMKQIVKINFKHIFAVVEWSTEELMFQYDQDQHHLYDTTISLRLFGHFTLFYVESTRHNFTSF